MTTALQPEQFQSAAKLPDGTIIRLRSVRPEDASLLQDFAAHMAPRTCGFASSPRCED
jgi:hypothetical protein